MLEETADVNPLSFGMEEDTQSSYDFQARVLHVVVKKKILGMWFFFLVGKSWLLF